MPSHGGLVQEQIARQPGEQVGAAAVLFEEQFQPFNLVVGERLIRGGRFVEVGSREAPFAKQQHTRQSQRRGHLPTPSVAAEPRGHLDHAQGVVGIGQAQRRGIRDDAFQGLGDVAERVREVVHGHRVVRTQEQLQLGAPEVRGEAFELRGQEGDLRNRWLGREAETAGPERLAPARPGDQPSLRCLHDEIDGEEVARRRAVDHPPRQPMHPGHQGNIAPVEKGRRGTEIPQRLGADGSARVDCAVEVGEVGVGNARCANRDGDLLAGGGIEFGA